MKKCNICCHSKILKYITRVFLHLYYFWGSFNFYFVCIYATKFTLACRYSLDRIYNALILQIKIFLIIIINIIMSGWRSLCRFRCHFSHPRNASIQRTTAHTVSLCVFICHPLIISPEFTFDFHFILFALFWVNSNRRVGFIMRRFAWPQHNVSALIGIIPFVDGRQGKREKWSFRLQCWLNYHQIKPQNDIDLSFTHSSFALNFNYYLFSSS